jgi:hypothetical protein
MAVVGGSPVIYYWTGPSAAGLAVRDVTLHRWTASGGSQQIEAFANTNSPTGVEPKFTPQIAVDATNVAYNVWTPAGASPASISTVVRSVNGGATTRIGGKSHALSMRGGVAMWHENFPPLGSPNGTDIWVWSQAQGPQLMEANNPWLGGIEPASGHAVFAVGADAALYTWDGATGVKTDLATSPPLNYFATEGWAYYYTATTIYRVRPGIAPT